MYEYKDFKDSFWGSNGFEELKKYMRLGNEFCKDLGSILTERAEHEIAYSKGLNRTSARLQKLAKDFHGTLSEAWLQVSIQFDAEADAHKSLAGALQEEIVKPLKILADNQIKCRKPVELKIEKVLKNLSDKKTDDYKYRSRCIQLSKDIEKSMYNLDEAQRGVSGKPPNQKELQKIEAQIIKTKEYLEKSEVKYHKSCAAVELARQDWQVEMIKACSQMQLIEADRINSLEQLIKKLSLQMSLMSRKMQKTVEVFSNLKVDCTQDILTACKKYGTTGNGNQCDQEIYLYDIYAENTRNMMNKDRRIANLSKWAQMFNADVQAQQKARTGLEKVKSFARENPNFNANNDVEVEIKLESVGLMQLLYEASLFKVQSALAELLDTTPRPSFAYVNQMTTTYDKQGVPMTILKHTAPSIVSTATLTSPPPQLTAPSSSSSLYNASSSGGGQQQQPSPPHSPSMRSVSSLPMPQPPSTLPPALPSAPPPSAPLISMPMPVQIGFTLLHHAGVYDGSSSSSSSSNNYESSSSSTSSVSPNLNPATTSDEPPTAPRSEFLLTAASNRTVIASTSTAAAAVDRPPSYIAATSTLKKTIITNNNESTSNSHMMIENHYNNTSLSDERRGRSMTMTNIENESNPNQSRRLVSRRAAPKTPPLAPSSHNNNPNNHNNNNNPNKPPLIKSNTLERSSNLNSVRRNNNTNTSRRHHMSSSSPSRPLINVISQVPSLSIIISPSSMTDNGGSTANLNLQHQRVTFIQDEDDDEDEWNDGPYKQVGKCVAQYDFKATRSDELNILSGDEIVIIEKRTDGWWKGKLNDSIGLFPSTYVKES